MGPGPDNLKGGFAGDRGPATESMLNIPMDLGFDGRDNLYIADKYNHRIRRIDALTGIITTVAGNGKAGFSGDGGLATEASLSLPEGIFIAPSGVLYIADTGNHRIRLVKDVAVPMDVIPRGKQLTTLAKIKRTALMQNFPNPFNPETWIPYQLAAETDVEISIYSVDGKRIRALQLGTQPSGEYITRDKAAYWDGRSHKGERVSSGTYFFHFQAGDYSATRKMLILK